MGNGKYHLLVSDMRLFDEEYLFQHFTMNPTSFEEILSVVAPIIMKSRRKREPIAAVERSCVTLRYLVTGDAQTTISASYRLSKTSISRIVHETSEALWEALSSQSYLKVPGSEADWIAITDQFESSYIFLYFYSNPKVVTGLNYRLISNK